MTWLLISCQLVIGLGLLNVWLLRGKKATPCRGGDAQNMREEFAAYGLPPWFMWVIGIVKVTLAILLIASAEWRGRGTCVGGESAYDMDPPQTFHSTTPLLCKFSSSPSCIPSLTS